MRCIWKFILCLLLVGCLNTNKESSKNTSNVISEEDWESPLIKEVVRLRSQSSGLREVDYLHLLNNNKLVSEVNFSKSDSKPKMIARRPTISNSQSSQGAFYLLPFIHHKHEDLLVDWDGKEDFQDFLFKKDHLIAVGGDSLIKFIRPNNFEILLAED